MNNTVVELRDVSKSYTLGDARVDALKSVTLAVARGEMVAIQGPSGSGKSTLLNICGLIDTPDAGTFLLHDEVTNTLTPRQRAIYRRRTIGFIFQSFNLVPVMTVYENVEYPLILGGVDDALRTTRVTEILARVGLAKHAHHLPDQLSGGQRQRVAIARALVKKPLLVIADEPTANLDSTTASTMIEMMKSMTDVENVTFLVATHDERMARHCHRELRIIDGGLV
ncbi:MAG: ABC transporter ATP-binding protein [Gammaproteobacteria bacterium]|nr:ABC transporter ATP-binding protein [Gammaproteobacteria bacterium]